MSLSADELGIILLSLKVALVSVAFSLPVAIGVAYLLARFEFPGKTLLDAVVHLPLVLPPVVVGFALLVLFGRRGPIGAWLALRSAVVAAVALGSWPSPRPVSSGPTASCRCPVLIVFRGSSHPPQAQCQPRAVFRIEEKQEFSQWYRAAIDGLRRLVSLQSGQFLFC